MLLYRICKSNLCIFGQDFKLITPIIHLPTMIESRHSPVGTVQCSMLTQHFCFPKLLARTTAQEYSEESCFYYNTVLLPWHRALCFYYDTIIEERDLLQYHQASLSLSLYYSSTSTRYLGVKLLLRYRNRTMCLCFHHGSVV